jgi:hypothetical protein
MVVILNTWFTEDKSPCSGLSFCMLVPSIVMEVKILLICEIWVSNTGSFRAPPYRSLWDVALCSLLEVCHFSEGHTASVLVSKEGRSQQVAYYKQGFLFSPEDRGSAFLLNTGELYWTAWYTLTAVRTWNPTYWSWLPVCLLYCPPSCLSCYGLVYTIYPFCESHTEKCWFFLSVCTDENITICLSHVYTYWTPFLVFLCDQ